MHDSASHYDISCWTCTGDKKLIFYEFGHEKSYKNYGSYEFKFELVYYGSYKLW